MCKISSYDIWLFEDFWPEPEPDVEKWLDIQPVC